MGEFKNWSVILGCRVKISRGSTVALGQYRLCARGELRDVQSSTLITFFCFTSTLYPGTRVPSQRLFSPSPRSLLLSPSLPSPLSFPPSPPSSLFPTLLIRSLTYFSFFYYVSIMFRSKGTLIARKESLPYLVMLKSFNLKGGDAHPGSSPPPPVYPSAAEAPSPH